MSLIFLDTKSSVVTSRVITWNDSQLITLLIMDKYNAQEPRTVNTIVKLINNSRGKYKRNTYLINICKSDTDFVLIYISFKFDFLRKYH